jgi:exodeoxyribonuclease V gamma subunit
MLKVVHGNRVEALLDGLLAALPPLDPFAPATIVVGSRLVQRWLVREIAVARGLATGLDFVGFDAFVERVWAAGGVQAIDRARLTAAFASALAEDALVQRLPAVADYLAAAGERGDRAAPRRVQLAGQLAELCWAYAATRPDWMPALAVGRVPEELAGDPDASWQAVLTASALARFGGELPGELRAGPTPMLPWLRRRAGLPPPALPPVSVFGVQTWTRARLDALTDLAQRTDVCAYVLDPCRELWDDVASRGAATEAAADPLPLVLWGRPIRDAMTELVQRSDGDVDDRFVASARDAALPRLLDDVVARALPGAPVAQPGVEVLACPNVRREVEVVADAIRGWLDRDALLRAPDIAVWVAGDAEHHLAQLPSALEAVGVPCHLVDAPLDDRGRIAEAVLALLELPTSPMRRRDLLRVMTHPAVLAAYPHVDAADWIAWTERLGIAHGADADAHAGSYLADHPERFHWHQGIRRLALGAFMAGGAGVPPVRIADVEIAPEEVRADQQASAATYALLVRSLCADADWLGDHVATLADWGALLANLVDAYLAAPARDDGARRDLERVRGMLVDLHHLDVDGREVGFREARAHAARALVRARGDRGEPLADGVMVAPLRANRAVPFRVAFVVGLDEGAFPGGDRPAALDLRRAGRRGDVSPRDRDRAAFLDVLLSARDAVYLSYVAVEPKGGARVNPSSVVVELADALAPYLGAASSADALARITTRHPLHRHTSTPATGAARRPAIAREAWAVQVRDAMRAHLVAAGAPVPDEDGLLALLAHPSQAALRDALALGAAESPTVAAPRPPSRRTPARPELSIATLRDFLDAPVQAWADAVLGIDELPDDDTRDRSDEPFHVARPRRTQVLRDVFAASLHSGGDVAAATARCHAAIVADLELRGQFPVGVFGEAARDGDLAVLARWHAGLATVVPTIEGVSRVGFGRSMTAATLRPALELALPGGRAVRLVGQTELLAREPGSDRLVSLVGVANEVDKKSRYHLRGALDHAVLAAAGVATAGHAHVLLPTEGKPLRVEHAAWDAADARAYLAALAAELLDDSHGYLLPLAEMARAVFGGSTRGRDEDLLGYGPLERADGLAAPPDAAAIARRRLLPLTSRMTGDHGFVAKGK